jgi:hypothetical protein
MMMIPSYIILLALATLFGTATAEDINATIVSSENDTAMIMGVCSIICAVILSFFGVTCGYVAVMEDTLLRCYQQDGVLIRAMVDPESIQLTRHVNDHRTTITKEIDCQNCNAMDDHESTRKNNESARECMVIIEYKSDDRNPQTFTKKVRKQVRTLESDFLTPQVVNDAALHHSPVVLDLPEELHISFEGPVPSHDYPYTGIAYQLDILQIPNYKCSGLSYNYVNRTCSWKYRLPTIMMVCMIIVLATLCIYVAVDLIGLVIWGNTESTWKRTCLVVSILLALEILIVHYCGEKLLYEMLQDEYLKGGETILDYGDSTSLSSGDDSYLRMR